MDSSDVLSILALVVSAIATGLTLKQVKDTNRVSRSPVLVIYWNDEKRGWLIRNAGNGPALNIIVAQQTEDGTNRWYAPRSLPPLAANESMELDWLRVESEPHNYSLGARYADFLNRRNKNTFFTYTRDDISTVYLPEKIPRWAMPRYKIHDITRYWVPGYLDRLQTKGQIRPGEATDVGD